MTFLLRSFSGVSPSGNCIYIFLFSPKKGQQLNVIIWYPKKEKAKAVNVLWVLGWELWWQSLLENKTPHKKWESGKFFCFVRLFWSFLGKLFRAQLFSCWAFRDFCDKKRCRGQKGNTRIHVHIRFFNMNPFQCRFNQMPSSLCVCVMNPFATTRMFFFFCFSPPRRRMVGFFMRWESFRKKRCQRRQWNLIYLA